MSIARVIPFFSCCLFSMLFLSGCPGGSDGPVVITCGGGAFFPCPRGMYCQMGPNCGGLDQRGTCARQPAECPEESSPVCGCDKIRYESACYANAAGVSVAYEGECMGAAPKPTDDE